MGIQDLILIGSGGCMRELLWQIEEWNKKKAMWNPIGYVDKHPCQSGTSSDLLVGNTCCPYLGDDDYLLARQQETNVAISVGESWLRKKIAEKLKCNPNIKFPNLIMDDARICPDIRMGQGCIISMGCRISTNVTLGDFVFLNMNSLVCHDGKIGEYTTLSPDVTVAGQVEVGRQCDIGMGTKIIQGITVGDSVIAGAGSVIVKNVDAGCTVVGVPAKRIKHN